MGKPDFNQLLKVINRVSADKPVLFDFFICDEIVSKLCSKDVAKLNGDDKLSAQMDAFIKAGYDYLTVKLDGFQFIHNERETAKSTQMTGKSSIKDRQDYKNYKWPKVENINKSSLDMHWYKNRYGNVKLIVYGPGGILENAIDILGYDNLCFMFYDDEELLEDIFNQIGESLYLYYCEVISHPNVGAVIYNDDWGYKTQTIISPDSLRKHIFPWVKKIVDIAHENDKPVILHSCGNLENIMEDIINMGFDAKHSYEDIILPVEKAYEKYGDRIAIMGGIDVDFISRAEPNKIEERCRAMLELSKTKGGYALGTGNSVPNYVPYNHYLAMLAAANITGFDI